VESVSYCLSALPDSIDRRLWKAIPRRLTSQLGNRVGFPLQEPKFLAGIRSYLTEKHGGNVHDERIVTLTSKSVVYSECRECG
jgi:hypothetical protein